MSLLRMTLRADRAGLLGWGIGLFVLTLAVAASYVAIKDDAEAFEEAFESFGGIEDAFGVESLTSPDGYYRSNSVALFPLLLGIYGALLVIKHLAGAEERGALDHLLARPLTRTRYLATVGGAAALGQLGILFMAALGGAIGYLMAQVAARDVLGVILATLEVLPIAIAHIALAAWIAVSVHRKGPAVAIAMGVVVGGYALDLIGKLVSALDWLEYLTLYGYWSRSDWYNGEVDALYLIVTLAVSALAAALAWRTFDRKDLY